MREMMRYNGIAGAGQTEKERLRRNQIVLFAQLIVRRADRKRTTYRAENQRATIQAD